MAYRTELSALGTVIDTKYSDSLEEAAEDWEALKDFWKNVCGDEDAYLKQDRNGSFQKDELLIAKLRETRQ